MTTFLEFLAGNAIALGAVAAVAIAIVVLFSLGDDRPAVAQPTRPVVTASDLDALDDIDEHGDLESRSDPVAVVGTPVVDDPLRAPFTGADAVAYTVRVASSLGHVATVRATTAFELEVDGTPVTVQPTDPHAVVVDDARHEHRRVHRTRGTVDDDTATALAAHDTGRGRVARVLSGGVLPGRTRRNYRLQVASATDPIAVVGVLSRNRGGDGWRLDPAPGTDALRFLDPTSVTTEPAPSVDDATVGRR